MVKQKREETHTVSGILTRQLMIRMVREANHIIEVTFEKMSEFAWRRKSLREVMGQVINFVMSERLSHKRGNGLAPEDRIGMEGRWLQES